MTILNKGHSFWDMTLLLELVKDLPQTERELFIVPGTVNKVEEVNEAINQFAKVLVIITSDEGDTFPIEGLLHPDIILYMMYPTERHKFVDRFLPIGYSPYELPEFTPKKLPWFFAGQINHPARQRLAEVLRTLSGGKLVESPGFSQGLPKQDYIQQMEYASVVPCPGGPLSPDSFRCYEALEMGAIPIADHPEFWRLLFGEVPFPTIETWDTLPDLITNLKDRPEVNNTCTAWWLRVKRELRWQLEDDLGVVRDGLTVLVPTSPIPSHPSTEIIEQTIKSVRERLPDSEIILMIDGVRDEQQDRKPNYVEYIRRLLWQSNHQWHNVYPLLFEDHQHQANMARETLRQVRTDKILYVEHDTPLDGEIPLAEISQLLDSGQANVVRLMHEAHILEPHKYLMLDEGQRFTRTAQWSQRPHFANTDYYRRMIDEHFPPTSRTMIEDKMHGVLMNAWQSRGQAGWNDHKVYIYTPEGDTKRSLNLDGRQDDPKYEMKYE